jgi:hypothetical protein
LFFDLESKMNGVGGWPIFAPPLQGLPHPSRFSKGEHHADRSGRFFCRNSGLSLSSTSTIRDLDSPTAKQRGSVVTTGGDKVQISGSVITVESIGHTCE